MPYLLHVYKAIIIYNRDKKVFSFKIDLLFSGAQDLIRKLLDKKPANRLPLEQVKEHFWISEMMNQPK